MDEYMPELVSSCKEINCSICSRSSTKLCSACKQVSYCSSEHQVTHWKKHIFECLPYKVLRNDALGRYAVAIRDLQKGEVVLREKPVAFGPKHYSPPVCLGCLSPIQSVQDLRRCTTCSWPVCSQECERKACHAENECPIFAAAQIRFMWNPACVGGESEEQTRIPDNPMLQCITPLRLLLAKERHPGRWTEEVEPMESHMSERRNSPNWKADLVNVSGFLRKACHLAEKYSDDDILWACGILQVNAFEARSGLGGSAQCLYPLLAIFAHSCVPNITHTIDSEFNMVGRVAVPIPRGQPLNTCYTHTLSTTMERRKFLHLTKFFDCNCNRCSDSTELGTNLSTLLCKRCADYYKGMVLSTNPLNPDASWKCNECGGERSAIAVEMLLDSLEAMVPGTRMRGDEFGPCTDDSMELEEALQHCSMVLHPNHSMLTSLRLTLCQLYGNIHNLKLADFLHIMLEHKVQLCKNVLAIADVMEPGLTRLRGTMLHELFEPLQLLARQAYKNCEIDDEEYLESLKELIVILEESVSILSLEEPGSVEAIMGLQAREMLNQLQNSLSCGDISFPVRIQGYNALLKLNKVFKDCKTDMGSQCEDLHEVKRRDKEDLKSFVTGFKNDVNSMNDNSLIELSDLNNIIHTLKKEKSKDNTTKDTLNELDEFQNMIDNVQREEIPLLI